MFCLTYLLVLVRDIFAYTQQKHFQRWPLKFIFWRLEYIIALFILILTLILLSVLERKSLDGQTDWIRVPFEVHSSKSGRFIPNAFASNDPEACIAGFPNFHHPILRYKYFLTRYHLSGRYIAEVTSADKPVGNRS